MTTISVFGANGKAGRRIVAEASARGHEVTAVVRDPAAYSGPRNPRIAVVAGDVTRPEDVQRVTDGALAVVGAASPATSPAAFFPAMARSLLAAQRQDQRLVVVGIGTTLEVAPGVALFDSPGFPTEGRDWSVGHAKELAVLRTRPDLDWLVVAPPPVLLDDAADSGLPYTTAVGTVTPGAGSFSYADLARAVVDEIETPRHRGVLLGVAR